MRAIEAGLYRSSALKAVQVSVHAAAHAFESEGMRLT